MSIVKSFSVGEGDMFYIKHASDNFTTIDCCLSYDSDTTSRKESILSEIERESKGKNIHRFISTHPDEDHISGLVDYDNRFGIVNFYRVDNTTTKYWSESDDFKRYKYLRDNSEKKFALSKDCSRRWMNQSNEERGSSGLFCLWPIVSNKKYQDALSVAAKGGSPNNISPVIRYAIDDFSFLWMGDMETEMQEEFEANVNVVPTTIVFAPHHGRKSGRIPAALLQKLSPSLIVVGEAPCEDLCYYSGYNTITQNSSGDILFDVNENYIDIFVANQMYNKDMGLIKRYSYIPHAGMHYMGSIKNKNNG